MFAVCCCDCGYYIGVTKNKFKGCMICKDCAKKKDAIWNVIGNNFVKL